MGWLISAASSAVTGHVSGRSTSWWTGSNSLWGRLTGGGSDRSDNTGTTVTTPRSNGGMNPLIIAAIAYFVFVK
tara:strand:+ start:1161 stop:1382 length:222 start_codon:yes stop_codon:yes gene_type:complete